MISPEDDEKMMAENIDYVKAYYEAYIERLEAALYLTMDELKMFGPGDETRSTSKMVDEMLDYVTDHDFYGNFLILSKKRKKEIENLKNGEK